MKRKVDQESDDEELPLLPLGKKSNFGEDTLQNSLPFEVDRIDPIPLIDADTTFINNTGLTFIDSDDDQVDQFQPPAPEPKQKLIEKTVMLSDLDMDDLFGPPQTSIKSNIFTSENIPSLGRAGATTSNVDIDTSPKTDYRKQPPGLFQSATSSSGVKLYFPKRRKSKVPNPMIQNQGKLLSNRISVLMDQARDQLKVYKVMQESIVEERIRQENFFDPLIPLVKPKKELWVDKYSPKMYTDLVGDEQIHRAVLTWVKHWDYCVFGKETKRVVEPARKFKKQSQNYIKVDERRRPEQKVLLISGPPGLGKTTLARVIATHAGYNIIEINGSDERTAEIVESKVTSAIQAQSSFITGKKPNCVIIDEIDGASASASSDTSFVTALVNLINGKSKKSKTTRDLTRPIICICNDPFARVLRPLKEIALHIQMQPPPFQALASRLGDICKWEGISANLQSLMLLCEMSGGDIRSALNTLQFLKGKGTVKLTNTEIKQFLVGQKDVSMGWNKVTTQVFQKQNFKKLGNLEKSMYKKIDQTDDYITRISELIRSNGDYKLITQACFENYLGIELIDVTGKDSQVESRYVQMGNQLYFFDLVSKAIQHDQQFQLQGYLSYPICSFHRLFSTTKSVKLEYPRSQYQVDSQAKQIRSLARSFWSGMSPKLQSVWSDENRNILELAPYLLRIISPDFRPTNPQILKQAEKHTLNRVVKTMVSFGLELKKQTSASNVISFVIEPPINSLVDLIPFCNARIAITDLPYSANQLIIQECLLLKIKQAQDLLAQRNEGKLDKAGDKSDILSPKLSNKRLQSKTSVSTKKVYDPSQRTIQLEDLVPTKILEAKPVRDFFGRIVKPKKVVEEVDLDDDLHIENQTLKKYTGAASDVLYKFKEGYSNAVRKPLYGVSKQTINMQKATSIFYESGKAAATGVDKLQEFAKEQKLAEKAQDLKVKAMDKYSKETGRNASMDGTILKYSAIATVGAVAISTAPAVIIGTAVAGSVVAIAGSQVENATKKYSEVTKRDGEADKNKIVEAASSAKKAIVEAGTDFKQGYQDNKGKPKTQ